jgi:hypothetical protein
LVFFSRYYITYHDSMHWFSIFFLNFLWPHFEFRSNSWCPPCVLRVCPPPPKVWDGFRGSTPSGHLQVFSLNFLKCSLWSSSSNLHLNGFSSKII